MEKLDYHKINQTLDICEQQFLQLKQIKTVENKPGQNTIVERHRHVCSVAKEYPPVLETIMGEVYLCYFDIEEFQRLFKAYTTGTTDVVLSDGLTVQRFDSLDDLGRRVAEEGTALAEKTRIRMRVEKLRKEYQNLISPNHIHKENLTLLGKLAVHLADNRDEMEKRSNYLLAQFERTE